MREQRQKFVLQAARFLGIHIQARILQRDRSPRRQAHREPLVAFAETADPGVAEKQAADDLAGSDSYRDHQIASHRRGGKLRPLERDRVSVARILGDVVSANHAAAAERTAEYVLGPERGRLRKGFARRAGHGAERVGLVPVIGGVVEKRAILRRRQIGRRIDHRLDDGVAIEACGDDGPDLVQRLGDQRVLFEQFDPFGLRIPQRADVARRLRRADDAAGAVANRRDGQRNLDEAAVFAAPDGFE